MDQAKSKDRVTVTGMGCEPLEGHMMAPWNALTNRMIIFGWRTSAACKDREFRVRLA